MPTIDEAIKRLERSNDSLREEISRLVKERDEARAGAQVNLEAANRLKGHRDELQRILNEARKLLGGNFEKHNTRHGYPDEDDYLVWPSSPPHQGSGGKRVDGDWPRYMFGEVERIKGQIAWLHIALEAVQKHNEELRRAANSRAD